MPKSAMLCSTDRVDRNYLGSRGRSARNRSLARELLTARLRGPIVETTEDIESLSDEALLTRYRDARRPEDFAEIVRRYSGVLGRYLLRYLGDAGMAEDVLQDTFLRLHSKCGLYRDGRPARPWLYAIALHRAVDALRRCDRLPTVGLDPGRASDETASLVDLLADAEPGPLDELQEVERQRWVRDSVTRLPEPLRQVLVLAYYQGLAYAEIVELLGIPLGTVKSRLHTAIGRLREMGERYDRSGSR